MLISMVLSMSSNTFYHDIYQQGCISTDEVLLWRDNHNFDTFHTNEHQSVDDHGNFDRLDYRNAHEAPYCDYLYRKFYVGNYNIAYNKQHAQQHDRDLHISQHYGQEPDTSQHHDHVFVLIGISFQHRDREFVVEDIFFHCNGREPIAISILHHDHEFVEIWFQRHGHEFVEDSICRL
ncbi:hypothetical protein NPIL_274821 [Nephila pilipes]|uniref:Uncharacterized protein n=1 Tax=Nephila pilipes TaxID=299642 RepID=A0A8X6Q393_NEPPI|nr:hypothetical protein NPIL_274821 [Nephila pilipes]